MAAAGIVMETINLPEGNAFGVDDVESGTPTVDYAEHQAKTLFFVWVTLTEQKWVIFGERRGGIVATLAVCAISARIDATLSTPFTSLANGGSAEIGRRPAASQTPS